MPGGIDGYPLHSYLGWCDLIHYGWESWCKRKIGEFQINKVIRYPDSAAAVWKLILRGGIIHNNWKCAKYFFDLINVSVF